MPETSPPAPRRSLWARLSRGQSPGAWLMEMISFLGVGGVAYVVDVGLFNLLVYGPGPLQPTEGQILAAKVASAAVAILVAWVGNRLWTFRDRRSSRPLRELAGFVVVNLAALLVTVGTLAVGLRLGFTGPVAVNLAGNVVGVGLGTLVRYLGYRYWLFTGDGAGDPR